MTARTFWRQLRRESRGGGARLVFFVGCLAVGVGAVVSVASFSDALDQGIRREARALLAADFAARSRAPLDEALVAAVEAVPGSETTAILEMPTVVAAPGDEATGAPGTSRLVELKSIDGQYPFYGELELDPPRPLGELLDAESAVVGPELLRRLGLERGDLLKIGGAEFTIAGTVENEPDRVVSAFSLGPRVFVSAAGLERAGLEQYGSRITYRLLARLPEMDDERLTSLVESFEATIEDPSQVRLETWREAQPALRRGLERTERYLGLAALLSLLVGGVGVAQTVRSWLAGRLDAIAVYRCLGYRPRDVAWLYLGQTALLGLAASLLGIALGVALLAVPAATLGGLLPVDEIDPIQPWAWLRGLALGTGVALLFAIPPVAAARRVPPIRVLRRSAEPLPPSRAARWATGAALLFGVFFLSASQAESARDGAIFTLGLALLAGLLALAARGLMTLAARPRRRARLWLRQGFAALARPGAGTVGAVVALGLGVLVVLAMFLVERGLTSELRRELPSGSPSVFFIDIQPDQWQGVRETIESAGAASLDTAPVVMGRLRAIDGRDVEELVEEREAAEERGEEALDTWPLRRELRFTYLDELPEDNEILEIEGGADALWSNPDAGEISIEEEFARELGVGLGTILRFDIQGVPLELRVTSLRTVDWSTFGINFFLVAEPEALRDAPQHRLAAARLPDAAIQTVQDRLAVDYPNVTVIQIREVLERVTAILERLGLGIRVLGGLTVLVGLAILAGAVGASAARRGRQVALFKTLGMTRLQVVAAYATEYALVGLVAGTLGIAGATLLAWGVLTEGLDVPFRPAAIHFPIALALTLALSVLAGLSASVGALRKRPVEVLRGEG